MKIAIPRKYSVNAPRSKSRAGIETGFKRDFASKIVTDCHGRPVLARLVHLARALRKGRRITVRKMAEELEVDVRTVRRDLDFLRERLRYDFEWDAREWTYRLISAPKPVL